MPRTQRKARTLQRAPRRSADPVTPRLSPERAFVVQLERSDRPSPGTIRGRVEHLSSGEAERFGSLADLAGFLCRFQGGDA